MGDLGESYGYDYLFSRLRMGSCFFEGVVGVVGIMIKWLVYWLIIVYFFDVNCFGGVRVFLG